MTRTRNRLCNTSVFVAVFAAGILLFSSFLYAEDESPLSKKGMKRFGVNFGYGYSFESNRHVRFASIYPYLGYVLTDPVGKGWSSGTLECIAEGAFSYLHKNQKTYSTGTNLLARYNFLCSSESLRPYLQAGFGIVYTNFSMHDFGSRFNFASNAACGLQYFFNSSDAVSFEWRYFHLSNAGIDSDNRGLNMNNFFLGFSSLF